MRPLIAFFALLLVSHAKGNDSTAWGVYQTAGGMYVLTVTLLSNGNYLARWEGDIGQHGTARGEWSLSNGEVHLRPKKEEGHPMTGHLRTLLLLEKDGRRALLRKEDAAYRDNPLFYLYLKNPRPHSEPEK